jgi:pyruvate dehydrogenase E2 component (dihydrolipoamide acetyltransferase)
VMTVNLTADHRAVDGALAAEFLRTLKGLLEEPTLMLL